MLLRQYILLFFAVCGGPLLGLSGVFTSPNFPDNYDNLNLCVWTITLATGLTLRVDFTVFELQFW